MVKARRSFLSFSRHNTKEVNKSLLPGASLMEKGRATALEVNGALIKSENPSTWDYATIDLG
jgi:hypothetical protein